MTSQPAPRSRDASMSLINELLHRPLDPAYAAAAERRRLAGDDAPQRPRGALVIGTVLAIGLLLGISATTLNARQTERSAARADLVAQIESRRERIEVNAARVSELQDEVALAQEQIVRDSAGLAAAGLTSALTVSVGAVGVRGPGLVVTMDDAPVDISADSGATNPGRVVSQDLQIVVNALWASGAEAIDVNGQRLTSRTAIRFAGEAIIVNYRPLTRPYVIRAIGETDGLTQKFAGGQGGAYLKALSDNFGTKVAVTAETEIIMTSASALRLENAEPTRAGDTQ